MNDKPNYERLLRLLADANANIIVIGAVAMTMRDADFVTQDLDLCYQQSPQNAERMCRALAPVCPAIRSAFTDTIDLLATDPRGGNFKTDLGDIDLLVEVAGLGNYETVSHYTTLVTLEDITVQALTLDGLIKAKEAAGRPKDLVHLITLRALKEMEDKEADAEE